MKFVSTRNPEKIVGFEKAVLDCLPEDGGLYVPEDFADLRKWILYTDEKTTFASVAGALTSACINEEFSPIISETIASKAFPFSPELKKLDEGLFLMELFHTPTGSHKDFGISYLINCLETILTMRGRTAVLLDATVGELGASVAKLIRGKRKVKAVLLYPTRPKRKMRGLLEGDLIENGGNVLPIEIDGTEADCHTIVRQIFSDRNSVERFNLTMANTANIGRLLPQSFFYPFAFSRLKKQVYGDIFYAMPPGNYSNLVAGLYSWRLSLPVNGFICPTSGELKLDPRGNCEIMDSMVEFSKREPCDPASPSNIERLENVFSANSVMLRHFIYPSEVSDADAVCACQELFTKFGIFADRTTSGAYASFKKRREMASEDGGAVVLVERDHPALSAEFVKHSLGEVPDLPQNVADALKPCEIGKPPAKSAGEVLERIAGKIG